MPTRCLGPRGGGAIADSPAICRARSCNLAFAAYSCSTLSATMHKDVIPESLPRPTDQGARIDPRHLWHGSPQRAALLEAGWLPPTDLSEADLLARARFLVELADAMGLVLTIEQRNLLPPRMGNYETVVSLRPKRERS